MQSITGKVFKYVNLKYKINISNVTPEIQTNVDFILCFGIAQNKIFLFCSVKYQQLCINDSFFITIQSNLSYESCGILVVISAFAALLLFQYQGDSLCIFQEKNNLLFVTMFLYFIYIFSPDYSICIEQKSNLLGREIFPGISHQISH